MLVLTRRMNESIVINGDIVVTLLEVGFLDDFCLVWMMDGCGVSSSSISKSDKSSSCSSSSFAWCLSANEERQQQEANVLV